MAINPIAKKKLLYLGFLIHFSKQLVGLDLGLPTIMKKKLKKKNEKKMVLSDRVFTLNKEY